jgi:hypothetical protein
MKGLRYAISIVMFLGVGTITLAAERSEFRFKAPITANEESAVPVRLTLSREIIAETVRGFSNLRLFDNRGTEVPYCIYTQRQPAPAGKTIQWKVIDYYHKEGTQTIRLERRAGDGAAPDLTLRTKDRDFNKGAEIYASVDLRSWKLITTGSFFDFSSQIDLRNTTIKLPATNARYLKVILKDNVRVIDLGEDIRLRYKDLEFSLSGRMTGEIKIDAFTSNLGRSRSEPPVFDSTTFSNPKAFLDKNKNTVVSLGRVNLPIERASLKIRNSYYYRSIELWTAETDDEKSYHRVAKDVVYKIPGLTEAQNTLSFNQPQQFYVMLKVINHDNPPLQIEEVTIAWLRRNLYFVPEADRHYTLYCGGEDIQAPRYEVEKLVPNRYDQLMGYAEWKIEGLQKNEVYKPKANPRSIEKLEKFLLTLLIIMLVCGLAIWTFRLMKKIPDNKSY